MTWKTTTPFIIAAAFAASMLAGCAAFNNTRPHDLTISGHEAAAATEEASAAKAAEDAKSIGRGAQYAHYMAPRYRGLAEAHRAAARALHDEEDKACKGVPADAAGAPLAGVKIASVDEIRQGTVPVVHSAKGYYPRYLLGARLKLQGVTASADVEKLLGCRIARTAAEGDDGVDPIAVKGTSVKVSSSPGDPPLLVEIRAEDQPSAAEVVRRAKALAAR